MPALQPPHGVDREASAFPPFEIAGADACPPCHDRGLGKPRIEGCHVFDVLLERIAGRNQPPHLVQPKYPHRFKTDAPVPGMSRVEGAAEEADACHGASASMSREAR